jgi:hypothetical protein
MKPEFICEECGAEAYKDGGEIEYADGRHAHFRKIPKGSVKPGQPVSIYCYGKFGAKKPREA